MWEGTVALPADDFLLSDSPVLFLLLIEVDLTDLVGPKGHGFIMLAECHRSLLPLSVLGKLRTGPARDDELNRYLLNPCSQPPHKCDFA